MRSQRSQQENHMPWKSTLPFSYVIEYANNHIGNEKYMQQIRDGAPQLMHTFQDTPLNSWAGSVIQTGGEEFRQITAEEMPARIESIKEFVRQAHEAGAERFIPYICTMIMVGHAETREGFWKLYDNWESFEPYGIGPKPETDPLEWLQTAGKPMQVEGLLNHEPTIHHPGWRRFLLACADLVAQCGYDGTFLDVNALVSYHEVDRLEFAEYLSDRYSGDDLLELFGFASDDDVRLGREGDGLLWFETCRFRACAMGKLFAEIRNVGRAHVDDFFVIVNNSPMSSIEAFYERRTCGHGLGYVHPACEAVMFEEMQQPGRFAIDHLNDCILQFKYSLAHGTKGVTLLYNAGNHHGNMLSNAEAAAGGGGAFVQPGIGTTEETHFWGEWFKKHAGMYEGMESVHDVGVVFFAEQMYWEDLIHVDSVYRIRQALSDNHILFDLLVEPHFGAGDLRGFKVVVVPSVQYMSREQMGVLIDYIADGGRLVIIGDCGIFDERGRSHEHSLRDMLGTQSGVYYADDLGALVPSRAPELFDLPQDKLNEFGAAPPSMADRVGSVEEAQLARDCALVETLNELTGMSLVFLDDDAPYTLRVNVYTHPRNGHIIVHLVNYDLPVVPKQPSGPPIPARNVRLNLAAKSARIWTPDGLSGEVLSADADGVIVPEVSVYAMIEVVLS
jgi:hypothetical protein